MKYPRRYWTLIVLVGITLAATWAAWRPISFDSREQTYVIPKGTWAKRTAGQSIAILPSEIRLTMDVRDILVLRNQDDVPQMFGPVLIMPGQSFELPFRVASVYLFACTFHASGQLSVVVVQMPQNAWERLWWRMTALVQPGPSS
jgi:hypothetical protein